MTDQTPAPAAKKPEPKFAKLDAKIVKSVEKHSPSTVAELIEKSSRRSRSPWGSGRRSSPRRRRRSAGPRWRARRATCPTR